MTVKSAIYFYCYYIKVNLIIIWAFRLFKYMLNIAEYHMKVLKNKKFPFIYPLVFYNGIQKYNVPLNLWALFEKSELVQATWINDCQLN
ncbi:Rpn family recombination-promoting nuclease/putative transposase [Rickettsia canadensis]